MLVRVQHIEAALPQLEKAVQAQSSHIHFAYTAGCEWHPKIRVKQKHFIHSDLPSFITDSYEECHDPPRLHLLDKFDTGGPGACLRRYSDPSFFRKAIARSEPMSAEKSQREKRARKRKKKSSRWKNGELSHAVLTSQCSGRMQFGSPNSYGQSSTGETISTIHMRLRSDQGDRSMSFDSRSRSGYFECAFGGSSSIQQEDKRHNSLPTASLDMPDNGTTDFIISNEQKTAPCDDLACGSLQDMNSSVTWVEKTEIVEPTNQQSDNIVEDEGIASEFMQGSSDLADEESRASTHRNIEVEDIKCISADIPVSFSQVDEFDDAGSEPDKYTDALNTLESEVETDSECHTKREVQDSLATLKDEGIDTGETHMVLQKSELSSPEFGTALYSSSNKQMSAIYSNLVSTGDLSYAQPSEISTIPSNPDIPVSVNVCEDAAVVDVLRVDSFESSLSVTSSSDSSVPNSQPPFYDKIISTFQESQGSLREVSEVPSVYVWTNGGLLGLEPSKPPDHSMSNIEPRISVASVEDTMDDLSLNTVLPVSNGITRKLDSLVKTSEQRENIPQSQVRRDRSQDIPNQIYLSSDQLATRKTIMDQTVNKSESCASYHDKEGDDILEDDSLLYISTTVSDAGLENSKSLCQSHSLSDAHGDGSKDTGVMTSQIEVLEVTGEKWPSHQSSQNKLDSSLSIFGLGQRFHENGYQRKESVLCDEIPGPLGIGKTGITRLSEPHGINQIGKGKVARHIPEQNFKNQPQNGSPIHSLPPSPPLEHMKISFHPMDGFEKSKLRLKFPGGHRFHESIKDVIFPSFQLLPEPAILLQDFDSESESDTFCRSSTDLSENLTSPRSESSSGQWESDDTPDSKNHEIYDALCKVSSVESISSDFELKGIPNGNIHENSAEPADCVKKYTCDPLFDLPSFDTVSSLVSQQECNPGTKDTQDSKLVPSPPPLPPVEWWVTKSPSGVADNEQVLTSKASSCPNDLVVLEDAPQPFKPDPQRLPHMKDISDCSVKSKQDHQKLYGSKEASNAENCKNVDERESLLNQIRSKSFSLKHTIPTTPPPSQSPTTNNKVTAILEKANAIHQAHIRSNEAGDENWSDG
ncbi:Scar-like protein [Thalictrum thalictroides]|uniref:Protein SCAR n=1 Tax=Thalictrum thalictroides TaxID=46969 RepID=A0A7J6X753_THATH|nr:Scar-like protein [Thalictrum thalictroides]